MRRLSVARDRELRHVASDRVAWRSRWSHGERYPEWYAWCRACERDATTQVIWLIGKGYLKAFTEVAPVPANVGYDPRFTVPYLKRYPR